MPKNWYAIHLPLKSRRVYREWSEVQPRVSGMKGSKFKGFDTWEEADFFAKYGRDMLNRRINGSSPSSGATQRPLETLLQDRCKTKPQAPTKGILKRPNETGNFAPIIRKPAGATVETLEDHVALVPFAKYYAVAVGRIPGLYGAWDGQGGAKEQTDGFPGARFRGFNDREEAIKYMAFHDFPRSEIRIFRKHFAERADFKPDHEASFSDQFKQLASTQRFDRAAFRRAKVHAIRDELISFYLPGGIPIDHLGEDNEIHLAPNETLQIYQAMCRHAGKLVGKTIAGCLLSLKQQPYVNIIDLINACRKKRNPQLFDDWDDFVDFTTEWGNMIPLHEAKRNEFLAPLLQDLRGDPPHIIDLLHTQHEWLSVNENGTPPCHLVKREQTSFPTCVKEESSTPPMLSPTTLSPTSTLCSASPVSDVFDLDDDMEDQLVEFASQYDNVTQIKVEPPSPSPVPRHPVEKNPSSNRKRAHSTTVEPQDLESALHRKRGCPQNPHSNATDAVAESPRLLFKKEELSSSPIEHLDLTSSQAPASPTSTMSDYGDDLDVVLDLNALIEPSGPLVMAQTQLPMVSAGTKRDRSMVDDSLDVISGTSRKHGRFTQ